MTIPTVRRGPPSRSRASELPAMAGRSDRCRDGRGLRAAPSRRLRTPASGVKPSWTTARTARSIAIGASLWKMLRPMSTPAAPSATALWAIWSASSSGKLLAAGHDDRDRAAGGDLLEALGAVVRLHDLGAELGADPGREAEVPRVPGEVLADGRHAEDRHPAACSPRRRAWSCCGRSASRTRRRRRPGRPSPTPPAAARRRRPSASCSLDSSLRIEGPPLARTTNPCWIVGGTMERRAPRVQHERVGVGDERQDVEVDPLQPRRGTLEVAVVDGEHDRVAAGGAEDARQPVLHPPVVGRRALQEEVLACRGHVGVELLGLDGICLGHRGCSLRAGSSGRWSAARSGAGRPPHGAEEAFLRKLEDARIDRGPARVVLVVGGPGRGLRLDGPLEADDPRRRLRRGRRTARRPGRRRSRRRGPSIP